MFFFLDIINKITSKFNVTFFGKRFLSYKNRYFISSKVIISKVKICIFRVYSLIGISTQVS